jgi:tetratricopeptide (TPR) repeat protein
VSSSLAQEIVRFVSGANSKDRPDGTTRIEVEPSLLSLVCHELNNKRRVLRQTTITPDLLAGSSDAILHDFYERCLADQAPAVRRFVEDQLLTDSGFRENIALERARKLLEQEGAPAAAIDQLIDRRLLHVEERLNVRRVELTHDILTGVVKASRDSRRAREEKEEAERQRELAEDQRRQAEERERRTRRQLRKARMTAAAFGVLLVAALVAVGWAILANKEAKREAKRAVEAEERYQRTAELAQRTADLAQRTAIEARARSLDYNSTIVALVDKMLENAVPEEAGMLRVLRAESLSALGKHREAVDEYKELLKVDPDNVIYSTSLGYEYINIGDSAKALAATNFALAHQEGSVAAFMNKGYLLGAQGDYEGATRAIKAGIELFAYTGPQMYIVQSTISPDIRRPQAKTPCSWTR